MRVVWFIYGDVFAHHPDLTIGTLSNGSRTQLQYNTVKDAGSDSFPGTSINPLGMSDNVSNWTNAPFRIVDFGSDDMSGWNGDIYIDTGDVDADGANFDQDVQVELHGNRARGSSTLQTDFGSGANWFSADDASNSWYSNDFKNSTSATAWEEFFSQMTSPIAAATGSPSLDLVLYKVRITTATSRTSSQYIVNTTGIGQTIAQRFNNATLYDPSDSNHVTAQRITANPHPSIQANGNGATGFILQGVDIANPYVNGVNITACSQTPGRNAFTKTTGTGLTNVGLDDVYGQADTSTTLTGYRSMNWTNYGVMSDGTGYTNQRPLVVEYYNGNGVWTMPDGFDGQECPVATIGTSGSVNSRYKLHTWMMMHAENAGYTADGNTRNFGSDPNMIIPNPPS